MSTENNNSFKDDIDLLRFITCGSVDDGKSTLIGRLLFDAKSLFDDQISAVTSKIDGEINLANVTDGLRSEREQGITIDVAYRYFATKNRRFIIADSPGHVQYTRNMVTAASTANLSLVLIDARKGVIEQTRRHTYISSLLRIPHLVICVNKMDLVDYSEDVFKKIQKDFSSMAAHLQTRDIEFIPMSALKGDNVVEYSDKMPWYSGAPLLKYLEKVYIANDRNLLDPRFPVQYVVRPRDDKFHDFRGYAGQVAGGVFKVGDKVRVLPSGKRSIIKEINTFDGNLKAAFAPQSVTMRLEDEIDISRGDMIVHQDYIPHISDELRAHICWMSEEPLDPRRKYLLKHCSKTVKAMITSVDYKTDIDSFEQDDSVSTLKLNDIGRVAIRTAKPLCFDNYRNNRYTGGFIIIDEASNLTVAAGMMLDPKKQIPITEYNDYSI